MDYFAGMLSRNLKLPAEVLVIDQAVETVGGQLSAGVYWIGMR